MTKFLVCFFCLLILRFMMISVHFFFHMLVFFCCVLLLVTSYNSFVLFLVIWMHNAHIQGTHTQRALCGVCLLSVRFFLCSSSCEHRGICQAKIHCRHALFAVAIASAIMLPCPWAKLHLSTMQKKKRFNRLRRTINHHGPRTHDSWGFYYACNMVCAFMSAIYMLFQPVGVAITNDLQ